MTIGDAMRSVTEMTKAELQTSRANRIAALDVASTTGQREEIQADLANINARLKMINIEEARHAKTVGDQRKSAGHAEQQDNLRRASAKLPVRLPAKQPTSPTPPSPPSPNVLTRGQFLLKHAKQMRKAIDSIKPDRRLPHTMEFHVQLDAFILRQKQHLDGQSEASSTKPSATDGDWKKTWTAEATE